MQEETEKELEARIETDGEEVAPEEETELRVEVELHELDQQGSKPSTAQTIPGSIETDV